MTPEDTTSCQIDYKLLNMSIIITILNKYVIINIVAKSTICKTNTIDHRRKERNKKYSKTILNTRRCVSYFQIIARYILGFIAIFKCKKVLMLTISG